ncbi:MAG: RHS repeat domain-containing protein [Luteibaculaceae bacterium]
MVFQTQKYSSLTSLVYITDYYPFGKELRFYKGEPNEKFLSTQHERDRASNYDHRQARNSTSEFGVFLSVDPHAESYTHATPYSYVENNPIIRIDPDGRDWYVYEKTGALMFLKEGIGDLSSSQIEIFGDGWKQIGADDMFGAGVSFNGLKVLSANCIHFNPDKAEVFMEEQGYQISTNLIYEIFQFTQLDWEGGIGSLMETTIEDIRTISVAYSYVKPENFVPNTELIDLDVKNPGNFSRQITKTVSETGLGRIPEPDRTTNSSNAAANLLTELVTKFMKHVLK